MVIIMCVDIINEKLKAPNDFDVVLMSFKSYEDEDTTELVNGDQEQYQFCDSKFHGIKYSNDSFLESCHISSNPLMKAWLNCNSSNLTNFEIKENAWWNRNNTNLTDFVIKENSGIIHIKGCPEEICQTIQFDLFTIITIVQLTISLQILGWVYIGLVTSSILKLCNKPPPTEPCPLADYPPTSYIEGLNAPTPSYIEDLNAPPPSYIEVLNVPPPSHIEFLNAPPPSYIEVLNALPPTYQEIISGDFIPEMHYLEAISPPNVEDVFQETHCLPDIDEVNIGTADISLPYGEECMMAAVAETSTLPCIEDGSEASATAIRSLPTIDEENEDTTETASSMIKKYCLETIATPNVEDLCEEAHILPDTDEENITAAGNTLSYVECMMAAKTSILPCIKDEREALAAAIRSLPQIAELNGNAAEIANSMIKMYCFETIATPNVEEKITAAGNTLPYVECMRAAKTSILPCIEVESQALAAEFGSLPYNERLI